MKRKLMILLFTVLMLMMFAVPTAASYRVIALSSSSGKWITQKADTYNNKTRNGRTYVYKVVVPTTGYLKIDIARSYDGCIYGSKKLSKSHSDDGYFENDYSGPPAHPGRSSAQPDRASVHLIRSAHQPMLAADQRTC